MKHVARSPRERSSLRAVLVDGAAHSAGSVRDISSSGLFVEAPMRLRVGQRVVVVPQLGDLEGVRLGAEVVRLVGRDGAALRFVERVREDTLQDVRKDKLPAGPAWARRVSPREPLPKDVPELVLDEPDGAELLAPLSAPSTALVLVGSTAPATPPELRRSPRLEHKLVVMLHGPSGARRLHAVDVAHHGLFVVTDDPPRDGQRVHITARLPEGTIDAIATVMRTVSPRVRSVDPGCGLQLMAMSDDDRELWRAYVDELAGPAAPTRTTARFLVRPGGLEGLREFETWHLAAHGTTLFTPELPAPGDGVTVLVVHPETGARFPIEAVVVSAHEERPRRLNVHFLAVDAGLRDDFRAFAVSGAVPVRLALPVAQEASERVVRLDGEAQPAAMSEDAPPVEPRDAQRETLAAENELLRAHIAELEEELGEAERTERSLFRKLHELEGA